MYQLASCNLTFPATKVAWEPTQSVLGNAYGDDEAELIATTGDVLRIWDLKKDWSGEMRSGYVGRGYETADQYVLGTRSVLTNVSGALFCRVYGGIEKLIFRARAHRRVYRPSLLLLGILNNRKV